MIVKKEIIEELSYELSLPYTGIEQDWEIEMANPERIKDFITFYQNNNLNVEKKVALMALILSSYDELLNNSDTIVDEKWNNIKEIIESDKLIFTELIDYWSLLKETEEKNAFNLTPLMRQIK